MAAVLTFRPALFETSGCVRRRKAIAGTTVLSTGSGCGTDFYLAVRAGLALQIGRWPPGRRFDPPRTNIKHRVCQRGERANEADNVEESRVVGRSTPPKRALF